MPLGVDNNFLNGTQSINHKIKFWYTGFYHNQNFLLYKTENKLEVNMRNHISIVGYSYNGKQLRNFLSELLIHTAK